MYQLLIVCPNEPDFIRECERYAKFKRESGITCLVHPFEHAIQKKSLVNLPFLENEGIDPGILEEASACLKVDILYYFRNTNTRFVLLAGDIDKIPVPWFEFQQGANRFFYPTDLYYADLTKLPPAIHKGFQTWDADKDMIKGEFRKGQISAIDFKPDIAIGRIPASSPSELRNAFARLMNRHNREPHCLLLRGNDDDPAITQWLDDTMNEAAERLQMRGYAVTKLSIPPGTKALKAQETLNKFYNKLEEGLEYLFWFGHGGPDTWGSFGPYPLNFNTFIPRLTRSPIIFSQSCDVGKFTHHVYDGVKYLSGRVLQEPLYLGSSQIPAVPDALQPFPSEMDADYAPEISLVKHRTGATALIAGHSWGLMNNACLSNQPLDFISYLPSRNDEIRCRYIGEVFNMMLYSYIETFKQDIVNDGTALNHLLRITLFGDPTTPLFY